MRSSKQYKNWNDIFLKLGSNIVSEKIWLSTIATIALFYGYINQIIWITLVAGLYGMGKIIKAIWISNQTEESMGTPDVPIEESEES